MGRLISSRLVLGIRPKANEASLARAQLSLLTESEGEREQNFL